MSTTPTTPSATAAPAGRRAPHRTQQLKHGTRRLVLGVCSRLGVEPVLSTDSRPGPTRQP